MKTRPPNYNAAIEEQCPPYPGEVVSKEEDSDSKSIKPADTLMSDDPVVTIHPLESRDGVLVKVQPPDQPLDSTADHVPCDIVLVIDVSGSMKAEAPAPVKDEQGNASKEHFGLTVLDLTKHAARTIVSTLNENDRLGIVTYSARADVVQTLVPMTELWRREVNTKIDRMDTDGWTNLWAGINEGLKLFEPGNPGGRVPALMVLTDGQPNFMCPAEGYVAKIRAMRPLPAIINAFGFGYDIKSGLLKSIVEAGNGNYAFIPDAGMIGTVFIHAVAHLQSTYATQCTLEISAPEGVLLKLRAGKSIDQEHDEETGCATMTVELGNLQYAQSRDIYFESIGEPRRESTDESRQETKSNLSEKDRMVHAKLTYSRMRTPQYITFAKQDILEKSPLQQSVIAYHQSRSMICELLSSFFSLQWNLEYCTTQPYDIGQYQKDLQAVIGSIPARGYEDEYNKSLMQDLNGQIREALSRPEYFDRWGCHFFYSLWNAHSKQLCNSFKDPGPLMYNKSQSFIRCRDVLNKAFDNIPAPMPSMASRATPGHGPRFFSMSAYNKSDGPCFAASSLVLLAMGHEVQVCTLRQDMMVQTPVGPRKVRAVLETRVRDNLMCRVGNLVATPWHPVKFDQSEHEDRDESKWALPMDVVEQTLHYSGTIYSVLLQPDRDVDAHAIRIGGVWGVTLGHGILSGSDVRAHQFLGDYNAISKELTTLGPSRHGVYCGAGVRRDASNGMVCGFKRPHSVHANDVGDMDRVRLPTGLPEICV
ncbi:U-box domain-containing protein [Xylariaceae sp. AK1471]|nr:U-box domain-containing protein [Xylariaceae sp. AK1471]